MNDSLISSYIEGNRRIIKILGLKIKLRRNTPPPISVDRIYVKYSTSCQCAEN